MSNGMLKFYKSIGALQIELIPARHNDKGYLDKDGAVLFTMAPGNKDKDNPVWDWTQKINFAAGIPDLAMILSESYNKDGDPLPARCFHQVGKAMKTLHVGRGQSSGWQITLNHKMEDGKTLNNMVYLTEGEMLILKKVCADLLVRISGFDS